MNICRKCNNSFPVKLLINNKIRNLQKRRFCITCSPFGIHNTRKILPEITHIENKIYKQCLQCKNTFILDENNFYFRKKNSRTTEYANCKTCHNKNTSDKQRDAKQQAVNYKGGKCAKCNYNKCLAALEFHHLDPSKKDFNINKMMSTTLTKEIQLELDKCILLCANCHRETHFGG